MSVPLLLADDLTGALDAGVAFTGAGALRVALRLDRADASTRVVDLGAREVVAELAREIGRRAGRAAAQAPEAFLKIDSLLRGPWPQLIAGVMDTGGFARCLLAPALPAQDRVTRDGRQRLRDAAGREATVGPDMAAALAAEGLGAASWREAAPPTAAVLIRDAASDDELAAAVAAAAALPGRTLWCGSGGLASAVAGGPSRDASPPRGRLLAVIGTQAPATLAQVAALRARRPAAVAAIGADVDAAAARLAAMDRAVAVFDIAAGATHAEAGAEIAARIAALAPRLRQPDVLFVSGGETLAALCAATGTEALSLLGRWRPGVPVSRLAGGAWDGVAVVSKSGAFGGMDLLADLWRATDSARS